jgi:hypothetical protein
MKRLHLFQRALWVVLVPMTLLAQDYPRRDSSLVFTPANPNLIQKNSYEPFRNAWGVDIMLSNN